MVVLAAPQAIQANPTAEPGDSEHLGCFECPLGAATAHTLQSGLKPAAPNKRSQTMGVHLQAEWVPAPHPVAQHLSSHFAESQSAQSMTDSHDQCHQQKQRSAGWSLD